MSELRTGYSTGTCAAVAALGATTALVEGQCPKQLAVSLPSGETAVLELEFARKDANGACAGVRKFAGDDPDITDGVLVVASVSPNSSSQVRLFSGAGVGTVTKPGLAVAPGQPAINPVPRNMITETVKRITHLGMDVTLSIPGGRKLAAKTFNPRLGILGGLSVLGTTGVVRPFSHKALESSLACALDVALAAGIHKVVFVPGNIGERAALRHFSVDSSQLIQVSNAWGFMLDQTKGRDIKSLLLVGHPGKLTKLAAGEFDTHSSRSKSAAPYVTSVAREIFGVCPPVALTVEGLFRTYSNHQKERLAQELAMRVRNVVSARLGNQQPVAVALIDLAGDLLGHSGDLSSWR